MRARLVIQSAGAFSPGHSLIAAARFPVIPKQVLNGEYHDFRPLLQLTPYCGSRVAPFGKSKWS